MIIHDVIWLESVEDKIIGKHNVQPYEVEEALLNKPHVRFMERGHQSGEDLYAAFSQTYGGRYLVQQSINSHQVLTSTLPPVEPHRLLFTDY